MIAPTSIQQPIAVIAQTQLPLDALRVDNNQLPHVPEPAKLFPSAAEREAAAKSNQANETEQATQKSSADAEQKVSAVDEDSKQQNNSNPETDNTHQANQQDREEPQQIPQIAPVDAGAGVQAPQRTDSAVAQKISESVGLVFKKGPNGVLLAVSGETSSILANAAAPETSLGKVIEAAPALLQPSSKELTDKGNVAASISESEEVSQSQQRLQQKLLNSGAFSVAQSGLAFSLSV